VQNVGEEPSWKAVIWKMEKEMGINVMMTLRKVDPEGERWVELA
jgi:hypothetical protein